MEQRHANFLRRVAQADRNWTHAGHDPEQFQLLGLGGMQRAIEHPAWDRSWPTPTPLDIDDLEELGYVRVLDGHGNRRDFALTGAGRRAAQQLEKAASVPVSPGGGHAPSALATLRWLVPAVHADPGILDTPIRILDRAVEDQVIDSTGRVSLARRVHELVDQGYLTGMFPGIDGTTAEQELANAWDLALTVQAEREVQDATVSREPAASITNIYNTIVNSQVAAGDITNTTTIVEVLAEIEVALDRLEDVEPEVKEEAKSLLRRLLGKSAEVGGEVVSDTAGALLSALLSKVLGLPPG